MDYPIPRAAVDALSAHKNSAPQNPGLIFDRFVPDWRQPGEVKSEGLKDVCKASAKADGRLLQGWNARWEVTVSAFRGRPRSLKTEWRLIAGLGRKGPLEVGFTFNRYGFPILPGSSVKGIARAYAHLVEERDESDSEFLTILGRAPQRGEDETVAQAGRAVFFDAIPAGVPRLERDIMNPHYPEYYQGNGYPTNWQNPVPVSFLTVAADTEFRFAVGWRGTWDESAQTLREQAEAWLIGGLTTLGAGAKTSAGYGFFQEPPAIPTAADLDAEKIEAFAVRLKALSNDRVAGEIEGIADAWRELDVREPAKRKIAQAIIDKVRAAKRERKSAEKSWYTQLVTYLEEHG